MKNILILAIIASFLGAGIGNTDARRRKKKAKPAATKATTAQAIKALQGKFAFGSGPKAVFSLLKAEIKAKYQKKIEKTSGDIAKDAVRRKMFQVIAKVKSNTMRFIGKKTGWDTSIIDDQFAHKNNESMVALVDLGEQKFFFFHNSKLYKIFISLPTKQFEGYNFAKFQMAMESAYGKAEEVYAKGEGGETELHHLKWAGSGGIELWALDKTDVYGNFVFILVNSSARQQVVASRKSRGIKVAGSGDFEINPIVKQVTKQTLPSQRKKKDKKK
ncbi:hypothetical protein KKF84_00440 [Myxococcota bacterium]|nr:hypothetical protein [Myxococcota bacterium]